MRLKRKEIQTLKQWIIFINGFTCNSKICHTVSHFKSVSHWLKIFLFRKGIIRPLKSIANPFNIFLLQNQYLLIRKQSWEHHSACLSIAIKHSSFPYQCTLKISHSNALYILYFNCLSLGNLNICAFNIFTLNDSIYVSFVRSF